MENLPRGWTRIENTSGTKESILHLLQLTEADVPIVLVTRAA